MTEHRQDVPPTPGPAASADRLAPAAETRERQAAWRRGEERASDLRAGGRAGAGDPALTSRAFAALADNVRDYAVFLMDPRGVITYWGEGARLVQHWTKEQAEGAHLRLLYPDGGSEDGTAEEHLAEAAETGEYTGEGMRVRADGSAFWARATLTALRGPDGALLGFAKLTRDLTARRAAHAALLATAQSAEQARAAAEDASRAKSLFLATMSHEIRTPLNSVMAYADVLDMGIGGPLTDAQRGHLGRIRASSQHLLGIIDDILDFSRMEAGRTAVRRDPVHLSVPAGEAVALVRLQAEARGVEVVDAASGSADGVAARADEERVRQVLVNLLTNAVKFTERGGRVTVSAGTAARLPAEATLPGTGPWAFVRVEDTGTGIPPERIGAIFEPFEQADMTYTRQHGGSGLGLAISRRLARLMDGDLTVRSTPGTGSTFFLWLPGVPSEEGAYAVAPDGERAGEGGVLRAVHDALLAEMERVLHAFVARLRSDPATPTVHALAEAELEDHMATFLADLAQTVGGLALQTAEAANSLRDGTAVQRVLADRHGRQRHRMGAAQIELRREFRVLREELSAALRRRLRAAADDAEEAVAVLAPFLDRAEQLSLAGYRDAATEAAAEAGSTDETGSGDGATDAGSEDDGSTGSAADR